MLKYYAGSSATFAIQPLEVRKLSLLAAYDFLMYEDAMKELIRPQLPFTQLEEYKTTQLIILGNGFDLACGLKSRYSDFFGQKFKQQLNTDSSPGHVYDQLLKSLGSPKGNVTSARSYPKLFFDTEAVSAIHTIWDLIFAYECSRRCPDTWADVEKTIKVWINNYDLKKMIAFLQSDDARRARYIQSEKQKACITFVTYIFTRDFHSKDTKSHVGYKDIQKLMLEDLYKFEDDFAAYLRECVDDEYQERARRLYENVSLQDLQNITGKEVGFDDVKDSVLSFNYTRPFDTDEPHWNTYRNIHGDIVNGHIIFGIDSLDSRGENLLTNESIAPFTKTYRIMKNAQPSPHHVFDSASSFVSISGSVSSVEVIKILGHSLAQADYSYFQSIFDQVNLYASDVVLIFYYMPHFGFDREHYYKTVVSLLSRYSKSLDNPDHGKNLIHKLILEDRLSVRELKRENSEVDV